MSEIKRITTKAAQRTKEGRDKPSIRKDDGYVIDLIYLLEESTRIIHALCQNKSPVADNALTIGKLHNILDEIEDKNLKSYFMNAVTNGLQRQVRETSTLGDLKVTGNAE